MINSAYRAVNPLDDYQGCFVKCKHSLDRTLHNSQIYHLHKCPDGTDFFLLNFQPVDKLFSGYLHQFRTNYTDVKNQHFQKQFFDKYNNFKVTR